MRLYVLVLSFLLAINQESLGQAYNLWSANGLPDITGVLEDSAATIWLATKGPLFSKTIGQSQFQIEPVDSFNSLNINRLKEFNGQIWIATNGSGAYYKSNGSWVNLSSNDGLPSNVVNDLAVDNNGAIWLACNGGVAKYDGVNTTLYTPFQDNSSIRSIACGNNRVFVSNWSFENNMVYDGNTWDTLQRPANFPLKTLTTRLSRMVFDDATNTLYATNYWTTGAIYSFKNGTWSTLIEGRFPQITEIKDSTIFGFCEFLFNSNNGQIDTVPGNIYYNYSFKCNALSRGKGASLWLAGSVQGGSQVVVNFFTEVSNTYSELETKGIKAGFSPGDIFSKQEGFLKFGQGGADDFFGKFTTNDSSETMMIYASHLWISGVINGVEVISANTYSIYGRDWMGGPLSNVYDSSYFNRYYRVWNVTEGDIQYHKLNNGFPGYIMPESIKNWPGNGDTSKGEQFQLAPFVDFNANGIYEPHLSDYPAIKGSQAVFFMFNNSRGIHDATFAPHADIEVHAMAYAYEKKGADLDSTIFISFKVFNRATDQIENLRFGIWTDVDLGNAYDDLVGCDSLEFVSYFYNADNDDEGMRGFGLNPPAMAIIFLNDSLGGSINYVRQSTGPVMMSEPNYFGDYQRLMDLRWKDSSSIYVENPSGLLNVNNGDGYLPSPQVGLIGTRFQYNDRYNWYESPASQYDKRNISVSTTRSLASEESRCFEVAYTYSQDKTGGHIGSLSKVKSRAKAIRMFYANEIFTCPETYVSIAEVDLLKPLSIFPNPALDILNLDSEGLDDITEISVWSISGTKMMELEGTSPFNISSLPSGFYIIKLVARNGNRMGRLIKR